jgi:hypothetical protein
MTMRAPPRCGWCGRAGSLDSAQHTLEFERSGGWQWLGEGSSSVQEFSLAGRPSALVNGPVSMMRLVSGSAARSRIDRERLAGGLGVAGAGWVTCAGSAWRPRPGSFGPGGGRFPFPVMASHRGVAITTRAGQAADRGGRRGRLAAV